MQKMRQQYSENSAWPGLHGSLVERQLPVRGNSCSSPVNFNIFNLGLSLSSYEMWPVQHYAPVPPSPPTPNQVHNVESHNILEINSHL